MPSTPAAPIAARTVAIVGAGPAGLMAAETIARAGIAVRVFDRMPSAGRKLLMAGRGGLNITHSEPFERFATRYGDRAAHLMPALNAWPPAATLAWLDGLGIDTFTGSSGRVFPKAMKASPLLRAWLTRLGGLPVSIETGHEWRGFDARGRLLFTGPDGADVAVAADAVVLALGGASWPRLGSNGAWADILAREGIAIAPLKPSNCGIIIDWSDHVSPRFAGAPLKRIAVTLCADTVRGEAVVTRTGLEGGVVYALSSRIRQAIEETGQAAIAIDFKPDMSREALAARLTTLPAKTSMPNRLRKAAALSPVTIALMRESGPLPAAPLSLADRIKETTLYARGVCGLDRAISTAGGVPFEAMTAGYMLAGKPGVFVAGEMIDWDAPTGGYLLQATLATAVAAANGVLARLCGAQPDRPQVAPLAGESRPY